ncbi:phosphodiesterase [Cellulomonas sp. ATA003]|uniref:phosphodiesterase n=1 Tax=Cellulomonas sp. ATA003 TaxID=3073064 RepID=UPI002873EC89|nr:phosphodiesterase [Cellulomonas sp. ATA003]WNB85169.1 phosphodiesterase [Cellulomonas sp. ATA003]
MTPRSAEHPRPRHFLVHLSDTHFVAPGALLHGTSDPRDRLTELLTGLEATGVPPEALIFTGDLADRGDADAYRSLRAVVEPVADRLGSQVVWAMGNHDDREALREELLGAPASGAPLDHVVMLGGLRLIVLDSTVPGWHHGEVEPGQLDWLRAVLAEPAPEGSILAMHHPPVPCVQDLATVVELRDQAVLAEVLRGTDVRAILAGHLHYSTSATFAGIPVSVASATCYTQDLQTPGRGTRGRDGAQAFNLVHVYADTVMHSVVPIGDHPTVGRHVDAEATDRLLAEAGVHIASAVAPDATGTPTPDSARPRDTDVSRGLV